MFAQLAMKLRARTTAVRTVHITDPEALTPIAGRSLMTTVYDLIPLKEGHDRRRVIARAGYSAYLRALRRVDILFAISGQTASDLIELLGVPADRVVIAAPGIDFPPPDDRAADDGRPYFLFLGGPNPNKNLSVLLEAMAICKELPVELRIAGQWLPKQVATLDSRLVADGLRDRVHYIGFVPTTELAALMTHAKALVVPSLHEGFGLPVGEGLTAGAVVIHSRIPVLQETSGDAALLFDPGSAGELAGCLRRVAGDEQLRRDLRRRGTERARELTWDTALERTLAAYSAVLSR
jgi:glycosyltransferase involved in cell wall biosynthesis